MNLLKKENWWIWLMLAFLSGGSSILVLGALLNVYEKEAWYYRWTKKLPKWVTIGLFICIGVVSLVSTLFFSYIFTYDSSYPNQLFTGLFSILLLLYMVISLTLAVFQIQILAQVNAKLKTPGSEIYLSPYIWILGIIIPIIGWSLLVVMYLYLQIWYLVMLYRGEGN